VCCKRRGHVGKAISGKVAAATYAAVTVVGALADIATQIFS